MNKLAHLQKIISVYDSALVAFSGGVDSTFLAKVVTMTLGNRVLLVTATSCTFLYSELETAKKTASDFGVPHRIIHSDELTIPEFIANTPERCYYCKRALFSTFKHIAQEENLAVVFEGSTIDDLSDYRPGRKAIRELAIISPLLDAELTKDEIRAYSKQMNLLTADKPSLACLASRFPYGETITQEKLQMVGSAEEAFRLLGLKQFRVRNHHHCARIEIARNEMEYAWKIRDKLSKICKKAGFNYVAIDCDGYRTGAMNEVL